MFGVNTWGQLGLGFKAATSKPVSVKGMQGPFSLYYQKKKL